jgi:hypothetical protein
MHLIQAMHASSGFFGHALDCGEALGIPGLVGGQLGMIGANKMVSSSESVC